MAIPSRRAAEAGQAKREPETLRRDRVRERDSDVLSRIIEGRRTLAAVEHAVKLAAEKHKVQFAPNIHVGPGTIIGRQIRQADLPVKQIEGLSKADITFTWPSFCGR